MNKTLLTRLRLICLRSALLAVAFSLATTVQADSGSADEAIWLSQLKNGAVANHWVGQSLDASEESFSLTDSDMHRLMSVFSQDKASDPAPKYNTKGLRYMTEVGSKQIQIQVMYAF